MENLFATFSPSDTATWKARLEKDLKGITFEQLSSTDRNGISVFPFYTGENIQEQPASIGAGRDWAIVAQVNVQDAKTANQEALQELQNGASGLSFVLHTNVDLDILLQEIELPFIYSHFHTGTIPSETFTDALQQYCRERGWDTELQHCFVSTDNIQIEAPLPYQVMVDGRMLLNAGATTVYELACITALVQEQLHHHDQSASLEAIRVLHISLSTDTGFFEQIAKLRTLRLMLQLVLKQYGVSPAIHIHAETADTYRAPFDRYNNLLRDSVAGMAAIAGGCDSLYIHPFDKFIGAENEFSKRMSRNQQLILKEESYFDKVADPAAGSYYIETLTEQFKKEAWKHFLEIEREGGFWKAFEKNIVQENIAAQRETLVEEYKSGKRVLVGVNKYPNKEDMPLAEPSAPEQNEAFPLLKLWEEIL